MTDIRKREKEAAESLKSRLKDETLSPGGIKSVVGLDGYVDEIVHVVDKRLSPYDYEKIGTIAEFGERISSFAEKSGNIEFVTQRTKIGGNGPIMVNALHSLGADTTYIGNLGRPDIDPVFRELSEKMTVHSLAPACHTDAVEFNDGKIMIGKSDPVVEITWDRILEVVGREKLAELLGGTDLLALVNWTMVSFMSDIWDKLLEEICPGLGDGSHEQFFFVDLADPQKRSDEAVLRMLEQLMEFQKYYRVILGVNAREAWQLSRIIGRADTEKAADPAVAMCEALAEYLDIYSVVVHPTHYAVTTIGGRTYRQEGPVTDRPVITTGAGDHFNAGFSLAQALGEAPQTSLLMGVCNSGYYVMKGESAGVGELVDFMGSWRDDPFGMNYKQF